MKHHSSLRTVRARRIVTALGLVSVLSLAAVQSATPSFAATGTWSFVRQPGDNVHVVRADDPARLSNAFTISGTLVGGDEQGGDKQILGHRKFGVSLDPSNAMLVATEGDDDATAEILDLGATETDDAGNFTVQIPALSGIEKYQEEDSSVALLFQSLDDDYELMLRTSVFLPHDAETQATANVPDDDVYQKSIASSIAKTTAQLPPPRLVKGQLNLAADAPEVTPAPVVVNDLTLTGTEVAAADTGAALQMRANEVSSSAKAKACNKAMGNTPWDSYGWYKKGPTYREWVPVQRAQTGHKTTMTYEWSNTKETTVGIVANLGYDGAGGVAVSGGSSKAVKQGSGLTFSVGHDVVRDLDAEYDFATYTLRCKVSGSSIYRDTKVTELRMYQFKGFSRTSHYTGYYRCLHKQYEGQIPAELWVSREATTTLDMTLGANGSYKGVGADMSLSSKQVNTTAHKKTYKETAAGGTICGENGNPTVTEKVLETS